MVGAVLVQAAPAAALRTPPSSACAVSRMAAEGLAGLKRVGLGA